MRRLCLLLVVLSLAAPLVAQADTNLRIHYHRFDDNYSGWGIHCWDAVEGGSGTFIIDGVTYDWQHPFMPTGSDDYGVYWDIPIAYPESELGFIIHNGDNKDPGPDMHWGDYEANPSIWILSGFTQIFTEEPNPDIRLMSAVSDGEDIIELNLAKDADQLEAFTVWEGDTELSIANRTATQPRLVRLTMAEPLDIATLYHVQDSVGGNEVVVQHNFDDTAYEYTEEDLGCTYTAASSTFKLWSPVASDAKLRIYDGPYPVEGESYDEHQLTPLEGHDGVWSVTVSGELKDLYYLYDMTVYGENYLTPDLYSIALSSNSQRTMIIDLEETDPEGWADDVRPTFSETESVVYELHVRDVTASEFWNGAAENKSKFLGVVEPGTSHEGKPTGFDHILDLGVNTVQILPMYDFSSVDENNPDSRNWGYDPYSYNTPEGSYSTDPDDGKVRIREMKEMIQKFHDAGIKVVMDVVYNHTHNIGPAGSLYDAMVPKYYYRLEDDGSYSNGSGVGNEVATEALMARRFIKQSCRYWIEEFHIDGFRFDLMGLMDTDIMTEITADAKALYPQAIIYGEPWGGYGAEVLTEKGDQRGLGFGCFNDNIRNAIRGSTDGIDGGYAMGVGSDRGAVWQGVEGAINDFTDGPTETINYISAHDNYTWWDKIDYRWNDNEVPPPGYDDATLIRMNKFGISMVLTAQGIPFIHAGSEFLRTKRTGEPGQSEEAIRNSYNQGDDVNKLDWARRVEYDEVVEYYKGLIALRHARPELRLTTKADIEAHQHEIADVPGDAIAYTLDDVTPEDSWGDLMVIHNPGGDPVDVSIPGGQWAVVVNADAAGTETLATIVSPESAPATVPVPGRSSLVLYQEGAPAVQLNIFQNQSLDRYLHLAVNALDGSTSVTVTVNGDEVAMTAQAEGSWIGEYVMDESGELVITVSGQTETLTRRITAWDLTHGAEGTSVDGRLEVVAPASNGWLTIADREGLPSLPADTWQVGVTGAMLPRGALVRVQAHEPGLEIQRRDRDQWVSLPTTVLTDGRLEATTNQLGQFRLAPLVELPQATRLLGNAPNPFNPETEIHFALSPADASAPVSLRVYDVRGQHLRTLVAGVLPAGPQAVTWDGRDDQGRTTPSGVYFYRLETRQQALTGRMLMVK